MKKILALVLTLCMVFALCTVSASAAKDGSVYWLNFKPELDVRGERLGDALDIVMHYIDDAIMVDVPTVRIIHGKGTGALHEEIQRYLRTVPGVASVADADVRNGESGVTVVTFE